MGVYPNGAATWLNAAIIHREDVNLLWELRSSEFKLTFIPASALLAMHSTYIGQLLRPAAVPLIVHMHVLLGGVAIIYDYPHPALLHKSQYLYLYKQIH